MEGYAIRLRLHRLPFFGSMGLSTITPGEVQEYRVHRIATSKTRKAPARSTIHDEVVTLRQVLKTAIRDELLAHPPDFSPPYKTSGKLVHRRGSVPRNTSNSMKPRVRTRRPARSITARVPSSCMTTCCSWPTPGG